MQTSYLLNHSLELRLAVSLFAVILLFVVVKAVYFVDEKITIFLKRRRETAASSPVRIMACPAAAAIR